MSCGTPSIAAARRSSSGVRAARYRSTSARTRSRTCRARMSSTSRGSSLLPMPCAACTARSRRCWGSCSCTDWHSRSSPHRISRSAPVSAWQPASASAISRALYSQVFSTLSWKCRSDQSEAFDRCIGHCRVPVTCPASSWSTALRSSKSAPVRSMYATSDTGSSPARSSNGVTCGSVPQCTRPCGGAWDSGTWSTTSPLRAKTALPYGSVLCRSASRVSYTVRQVASSAPCSRSCRATASAVRCRRCPMSSSCCERSTYAEAQDPGCSYSGVRNASSMDSSRKSLGGSACRAGTRSP